MRATIHSCLFCLCSWLFLAENVVCQVVSADQRRSMETMFNDYASGKIDSLKFLQFVDRQVDQASDRRVKRMLLEEAWDFPYGKVTVQSGVSHLMTHFSGERAVVSEEPGDVVEAIFEAGVSMENEAVTASGDEKKAKLLSALESLIAVSKIISENLSQRGYIDPPGVSGGGLIGSPDELKVLVARHNAEKLEREIILQQNKMIRLVIPLKHGMEHLKSELKLNDKEFAKIWDQVKARKFGKKDAGANNE